MTTTLTHNSVLLAAADYLDQPGTWGQEFFVGEGGCRCALGAIALAADPGDEDGDPMRVRFGDKNGPERAAAQQAVATLAYYLADELGAPWCVITDGVPNLVETVGGWNDDPLRTQAEVVGALRAAAGRVAVTA